VVKPLGIVERTLDRLFWVPMCLGAGTFKESPQQTHRWNNHHLSVHESALLDPRDAVMCPGIPRAGKHSLFRFHIPLLGGWRDYIVIRGCSGQPWHIGWHVPDVSKPVFGVSRIVLPGDSLVRLLIGQNDTYFFGVSQATGEQIPIMEFARGRIGDGGPYRRVTLL
jgi:hypothetical protein